MVIDHVKMGERLREAREAKRMTQHQVAQALYTDQSLISRYEYGSVVPRVDTLAVMASLYGVSLDWIVGMERADGRGPTKNCDWGRGLPCE